MTENEVRLLTFREVLSDRRPRPKGYGDLVERLARHLVRNHAKFVWETYGLFERHPSWGLWTNPATGLVERCTIGPISNEIVIHTIGNEGSYWASEIDKVFTRRTSHRVFRRDVLLTAKRWAEINHDQPDWVSLCAPLT